MSKLTNLLSAAATVRDATEESENTASRIGGLFVSIIQTLIDTMPEAQIDGTSLSYQASDSNFIISMKKMLDGTEIPLKIVIPAASSVYAGLLTPASLNKINENSKEIERIKSGQTIVPIAQKVSSGAIFRGFVGENTILPLENNAFYIANKAATIFDAEDNSIEVGDGVTMILRSNAQWKVYPFWILADSLTDQSPTHFLSAKQGYVLKRMIDQLAALGGAASDKISIDSSLSAESIFPVQNAVITAALNKVDASLAKLEQTVFPLEVTLLVRPSGTYKYTGAEVEVTLSWTTKIAGKTVTPSSVKLLVDDVEVDVSDGASSTTVKVVNDADVKLVVEADGRTATKTTKLNFAYPAYTDIVNSNFDVNAENVTRLTEMKLVDGRGRTYTYDKAIDREKIVYAYAKSYGALTGIIEGMNNGIDDYTRKEITIKGIDYYVYITTNYFSTEQAPTYKYE